MRKDQETIKKEFENYIEQHEAQRDAWKKVKRVTKKDGADFATLAKNFENAKIENCEYALRAEKQINVYTVTRSGRYINDYFSISPLVKDANFDVSEERVIKESMLSAYFHMNADEIEKAIEKRIEMHENSIKAYQEQINNLDKYYNRIIEQLEEIHETLNEITPKGANATNLSLRYAMEEVIKNYYFN